MPASVLSLLLLCCAVAFCHGAAFHRSDMKNLQLQRVLAGDMTLAEGIKRLKRSDSALPELLNELGYTTLVELVVAAGLAPTLSSDGPFTVFAPTNDAFSSLPTVIKASLTDMSVLEYILTFHVLAGSVTSDTLKDGLVPTVLGKDLRVNVYGDNVVTVQCAPINLEAVDKIASNGVVHEITRVMIPPSNTILDALATNSMYSTLTGAAVAASLQSILGSAPEDPYTVFAPTDAAFAKLPPGALDRLVANITELTSVLAYHVVKGVYCSAGLTSGAVTTLNGEDININLMPDGCVEVNTGKVIYADGSVTNGVVHTIDTVLLPPSLNL